MLVWKTSRGVEDHGTAERAWMVKNTALQSLQGDVFGEKSGPFAPSAIFLHSAAFPTAFYKKLLTMVKLSLGGPLWRAGSSRIDADSASGPRSQSTTGELMALWHKLVLIFTIESFHALYESPMELIGLDDSKSVAVRCVGAHRLPFPFIFLCVV